MAQMEVCVCVCAFTAVGRCHTPLTFEIDSIGRFACVNGSGGLAYPFHYVCIHKYASDGVFTLNLYHIHSDFIH